MNYVEPCLLRASVSVETNTVQSIVIPDCDLQLRRVAP